MNTKKFSILLQISTTIFRLAFFSIAIIEISKANNSLIFYIGLIPLFSILDVIFQANTRWNFSILEKHAELPNRLLFSIAAIAFFSSLLYAFGHKNDHLLLFPLVIAYLANSLTWRYESIFTKNQSVNFISITEMSISLLSYILFLFLHSHLFLMIIICAFPLSKIFYLSLAKHIAELNYSIPHKNDISRKITYIATYLLPSLIAAISATLPSLIANLAHNDKALGIAILVIRYVNSISAIFSLFINILASRIFFGTIGNKWHTLQERIIKLITAYYLSLFIFSIVSIIFIISDERNVIYTMLMVLTLIPIIAITNLFSSLCLANNIPQFALSSQLIILILSLYICLYLYDRNFFAILIFGFFSILFLVRQVKLPSKFQSIIND